jgi:hypothetical protein
MAASRASTNRKFRQEALRDQLAEQCRVQHVLENIKKMETQGAAMEAQELNALKYATDARIKLVSKYLPDLKSVELTGDEENPVEVKHALFEFNPVGADD